MKKISKNPAAQALGALGGAATRKKLTPEERAASARHAALSASKEVRSAAAKKAWATKRASSKLSRGKTGEKREK